jgi:hypothetical protein
MLSRQRQEYQIWEPWMPGSLDRKSPTGRQLTGRGQPGMAETYQQRLKVIGLLPPSQNWDLT